MLFFISLDIFYKGDDFSTISFVRFFQIFAHFFTEGQKLSSNVQFFDESSALRGQSNCRLLKRHIKKER
jgi:hypothetical protein